MSSSDPITIVGAGLTGSMLALMLARHPDSPEIRILESRPDPDKTAQNTASSDEPSMFGRLADTEKRSINLALSHRGISALKYVGLYEQVAELLIPMTGRVIHSITKEVTVQPYGQSHQAIYSVSRNTLNQLLIQQLKRLPNVTLVFNEKIKRVDSNATIETMSGEMYTSRLVIGADGAFSAVRRSLLRLSRVDFRQEYIKSGYKELTIFPKKGKFALEHPEGLHIWPRHNFMLIALPNPDKTFTATLFVPFEGPEGLDALSQLSDGGVLEYFRKYFPDVLDVIDPETLVAHFRESPNSPLLTINVDPWHAAGKICLIGDAAHAIVPFYGQGMNCGFEDCLVFEEIWKEYDGDIAKVVKEFSDVRRPAADGIAELSLRNYREMSSLTAQRWFVVKKTYVLRVSNSLFSIERCLHYLFPTFWIPLYTMVAFTRIPYHEAIVKSKKQDKVLAVGLVTGAVAFLAAAVYFLSKK